MEILDLSWVSANRGWAAAVRPRGGPIVVAGTTDGGKSWSVLAQVKGAVGAHPELRFANNDTGYLLAPGGLLVTRDGGHSWRRASTPRGYLWQLEVARSGVTLLANAPDAQHDGLCEPCRVYRAPLGSDQWTRTLTVPVRGSATLARSGDLVIVGGFPGGPTGPDQEAAQSWRSQDGGRTWHSYADPCADASFDGEHQWATGFAIAGRTVVAQCAAFYGMARYQGFTISSADAGDTFGPGRAAPCTETLAIGGAGTMVCSDPDTYTVRSSADGGRTWHRSYDYTVQRRSQEPNQSEPLDGCGMQNPTDGRCWLGQHLLTTHDAGRTWQLSTFQPTG
jgi:hypothetical protein